MLKTYFSYLCRKKGTGKFTWERSDDVLEDSLDDLWVNTTTHDIAGLKTGDSHQCVFLGPLNNTQEIFLDHADCTESVARPLCQYWVRWNSIVIFCQINLSDNMQMYVCRMQSKITNES